MMYISDLEHIGLISTHPNSRVNFLQLSIHLQKRQLYLKNCVTKLGQMLERTNYYALLDYILILFNTITLEMELSLSHLLFTPLRSLINLQLYSNSIRPSKFVKYLPVFVCNRDFPF